MLRSCVLVTTLVIQSMILVAPNAQAQTYTPPDRGQPDTSACAYTPGDRDVPGNLCAFTPPDRGMPSHRGGGGTR
jgi:hypothetical protein